MNNLTAILINFLRPRYTIDCIKSLRENYPDIHIWVGEQLKDDQEPNGALEEICQQYEANWKRLPYDCGVGAGRNALIDEVETEYVLVGDDDFLYDENAKVDQMLTFLENTDFDLVGGRIYENGRVRNYQGHINFHDDHIETNPVKSPDSIKTTEPESGLRFLKCDLTFNFFVIRTQVAKDNAWDENIKVAYEHHHFFTHLKKAGAKVAFSPDPIVQHKKQGYPVTAEYQRKRNRKSDKDYYHKSLGIKYSNGLR